MANNIGTTKIALCALTTILFASSVQADKIGDMRAKTPEFTTQASMNVFDVERCLIENVNIGKPWVYRQPDRPDLVSFVWDSREFGNTTLLEISGLKDLKIRFWGKDKMWHVLRYCIGQDLKLAE